MSALTLRALRAALLVATAIAVASAAFAAPSPDYGRALQRKRALLEHWARDGVQDASLEARLAATRDLEAILAHHPGDAEMWLLLGRVYQAGAFDSQARQCFRRAAVLMPNDPRAWMALGRAWKREWIRGLDTLAARRAEGAFDTACVVKPRASEHWLALVPLRLERGDLEGSLDAAQRALAIRRRNPEAMLAVAYVAYRRGDVERADTLFHEAIPRLQPDVRAMLLDAPSWFRGAAPQARRFVAAQGALSAPEPPQDAELAESAAGVRASRSATVDSAAAFWRRLDPDPTTAANEMQLEYWSRVAHAYFVFWDPDRPQLDARAETYVRYGPPAAVQNNPPGVPLAYAPPRAGDPRARSHLEYPMHVQGWFYPELGMRVVLNDRSLNGRFTPQVLREPDPLAMPSPEVLAKRGDLVALSGGVAVFPTLPPSAQRLDVRGTLLRFEGERGPRVLVQVQARGGPSDSLTARGVVLDKEGRELANVPVDLHASSCDPTEWRLAELAAELPPGAASVALSVRDAKRRRGLYRSETTLPPPAPGLAMSDVVLCCGDPARLAHAGLVQFESDPERLVTGREPISVYFELYRLRPGEDGRSRFEYEYRVRRLPARTERRPRGGEPPPVLTSHREESHAGTLRRQFVTVPVSALGPGRYRLEVRVRDLIAGDAVEGVVDFDRE